MGFNEPSLSAAGDRARSARANVLLPASMGLPLLADENTRCACTRPRHPTLLQRGCRCWRQKTRHDATLAQLRDAIDFNESAAVGSRKRSPKPISTLELGLTSMGVPLLAAKASARISSTKLQRSCRCWRQMTLRDLADSLREFLASIVLPLLAAEDALAL